jgi:hypothetical protein
MEAVCLRDQEQEELVGYLEDLAQVNSKVTQITMVVDMEVEDTVALRHRVKSLQHTLVRVVTAMGQEVATVGAVTGPRTLMGGPPEVVMVRTITEATTSLAALGRHRQVHHHDTVQVATVVWVEPLRTTMTTTAELSSEVPKIESMLAMRRTKVLRRPLMAMAMVTPLVVATHIRVHQALMAGKEEVTLQAQLTAIDSSLRKKRKRRKSVLQNSKCAR